MASLWLGEDAEMSVTVVGLDTASNRFHLVSNKLISRGRGETRKTTMKSGPWKGKEWDSDADKRRQQLFEDAKVAFSWLPAGSYVFCEEALALSRNGKTTRLLGLACGAIWAAHLEYDIFWRWTDVSEWKRAIIGNGNASKDEIALHVQLQGREYDEADYYDADALCQFGERWVDTAGLAC